MDYFPIFLDLRGRRCLVLGGGEAASAKAAMLARAGAEVTTAARFASALLGGVSLVIVAGAPRSVGEAVSSAAQARAIPVNVMDEPDLCSFIMPAVVERSPVMVAITTSGTAPVLAQLLRQWLDRTLPVRLGALATLAGSFRPLVKRRLGEVAARQRFWRRVFTGDAAAAALSGDDVTAAAELLRALGEAETRRDQVAA